jgi:deoxyribose-phosphate aldolase
MEKIIKSSLELASKIDHTLLKPDATFDNIKQLCEEAKEYNFASVCILPNYLIYAKDLLCGTSVKLCTVIGFPLGANVSSVKLYEMDEAIDNGADEVDIVVNNSFVKNNDYERYSDEIILMNKIAKSLGATTKFIIETALLTTEEKKKVTEIIVNAGADFVKTSTGFASSGATIEDVALMSKICEGTKSKVKASGGIRNLEFTLKLINVGAERIGTSSGVAIMKEFHNFDINQ